MIRTQKKKQQNTKNIYFDYIRFIVVVGVEHGLPRHGTGSL